MAIERNTYTDILFDALMAAGCTIYGACAAMGNIYAESGANPRNLENLCEKKLNYKYTDDTYTEAVDSADFSACGKAGHGTGEFYGGDTKRSGI